MLGVFGQTRSGKSIMAAQMLAGFAANRDLGILVLDPQGEFGRDRFAANDHRVDFSIKRLLGGLRNKREVSVISTDDVALEGSEAFTELLRLWVDALRRFRNDEGRIPLSQLIQRVLSDRAVVLLSFAQEGVDETPYFLLNEILTRLRQVIHRSFQHGQTSNALVLLDEAHLFAGENAPESADGKRTGRYTFMVTGPIVALGSLGTPLVLQGFRATDDLMRANPHCFNPMA